MAEYLPDDHPFGQPTKQVKSAGDMAKWQSSEAYQEYLGFIRAIGQAIRNKKISDTSVKVTDTMSKFLNLLDTLSQWVLTFPPVEQNQRFGNASFRQWHQHLEQRAKDLLRECVSDAAHLRSIDEISVYFCDSFGNATRIDYGTGHEMAFVMFLACLFKIGIFRLHCDEPAVGLVLFDKYMRLVRQLQITYRMEPAGSQGVWALDDYQFLPFVWGAAQLLDDPFIVPKSISDYSVAERLAADYHLFACIQYISSVKTGPFAEHSNQLWNVSGVPSWTKVYSGLIKMYCADVLAKFPIIQHTYFGSIFTLNPAKVMPSSIRPPLPNWTEAARPTH